MGGVAPGLISDHLPWVMLGIQASPKEKSGTSAGEAALGQRLAVRGQLLPVSGPPEGRPALSPGIPAVKKTYTEVATKPALERATHVYVQQVGVGHRWPTTMWGHA